MSESMVMVSNGKSSLCIGPTGHLRWNGGILEQVWEFRDTEVGGAVVQRLEWRAVPQVDAALKD
jgi:hypothetical protein